MTNTNLKVMLVSCMCLSVINRFAESFNDFEQSLMSMENIDRTSPELWPETSKDTFRDGLGGYFVIFCAVAVPGMSEFINTYNSPANPGKLPYSKEFTPEDNNYLHRKFLFCKDSHLVSLCQFHLG